MISYVLSIAVLAILLFIGDRFIQSNYSKRAYRKTCAIFLVCNLILQAGVVYIMTHPSSTTLYQGHVKRKWIDYRTHTETYQCGNSTCTRTVTTTHYMLKGSFANHSRTCEEEWEHSVWDTFEEGDAYVCAINEVNFTRLNKEMYATSDRILEKYRSQNKSSVFLRQNKDNTILPDTHVFVREDARYNFLHDFTHDNVNRSTISDKLANLNSQKPFAVEVFLTNADEDYQYAFLHSIKGVSPNQVILLYGLDNSNQDNIKWVKAFTMGQNEGNRDWILKWENKYALHQGNPLNFNKEWEKDVVYAMQSFKPIDNQHFVYLQDSVKNTVHLQVFIGMLLLQIITTIILVEKMNSNSRHLRW